MRRDKLFVYGSLMNQEVLDRLLRCRVKQSEAILPGYKRVLVTGETYPAIYAHKQSSVEGLLLTGLNNQQLACLDMFEGDLYERVSVTVDTAVTLDNANEPDAVYGKVRSIQECDTYLFKAEHRHLLSSDEWSNDNFRHHHMQSFLKKYCD